VAGLAVAVCNAISEVEASEWNALRGTECPFLRHEFLLAAEHSGSAVAETGWRPRHLVLRDGSGLRGAIPLYEKTHSWGEFVFDWAWAQAYEQAGLGYYPKLVSALPFTPASSRRILVRDPDDADAVATLLKAAVELAEDIECSSLHVLLPAEDELSSLVDHGFRLRKDCQFHWHNRNYDSFDDFLGLFSSAKRKKVRRERRRVAEAGIKFRHLRGGNIDAALWTTLYRLVGMTFVKRGSLPYFNLDFFRRIGRTMPDRLLVILAERREEPIAAAIFFESDDVLYGRYWGADGHYDALHFETCYYQGIEHCIANGRKVFEPGTQGEHKISRGFVPVATWSAHWLKHPQFFSAIGNYLREERQHVDRYMTAVDGHSPYRSDVDEPS
jgi:predicted N-acyltransferase